jgi:predicted extracellular nuclease
MTSSVVTVSAIVVGDFQTGDADNSRNTGGFYLQEEDSDSDNDASTSEGIYIYEGSTMKIDVKLGDLVEVTGTVAEYKETTQISKVTSVKIVSSSNSLPTAAVIVFPKSVIELEAYEAMRVAIDGEMIITDMYNLARYGEISLSKTRGYSYTQQNPPGNPAGYAAYLEEIAKNKITYDDGLVTQNNDISLLDGFGPSFSTATAPRMGDVMTGLAGILEYSFDKWRIRSTFDRQNSVTKVNTRTESPPDVFEGVNGAVKIASLNVLNFFTTLNKDGATTGPPPGLEPRGANSKEEFE